MRTLVDLLQQRSGSLGVAAEDSTYREVLNKVEAILSKEQTRINPPDRQKDIPKISYKAEELKEPVIPRIDGLPIEEKNGTVVCNFQFACYFSRIMQKIAAYKTISDPIIPEPIVPDPIMIPTKVKEKKKLKVTKRKRIDHFGELIVNRKLNNTSLQPPFDPQELLTPTSIRSGSTYEALISKSSIISTFYINSIRHNTRINVKTNTRSHL